MEVFRNPIDCKHYPLCRDVEMVARTIPASFSGLHAIVLQRKAEVLCCECRNFETKEMSETA